MCRWPWQGAPCVGGQCLRPAGTPWHTLAHRLPLPQPFKPLCLLCRPTPPTPLCPHVHSWPPSRPPPPSPRVSTPHLPPLLPSAAAPHGSRGDPRDPLPPGHQPRAVGDHAEDAAGAWAGAQLRDRPQQGADGWWRGGGWGGVDEGGAGEGGRVWRGCAGHSSASGRNLKLLRCQPGSQRPPLACMQVIAGTLKRIDKSHPVENIVA